MRGLEGDTVRVPRLGGRACGEGAHREKTLGAIPRTGHAPLECHLNRAISFFAIYLPEHELFTRDDRADALSHCSYPSGGRTGLCTINLNRARSFFVKQSQRKKGETETEERRRRGEEERERIAMHVALCKHVRTGTRSCTHHQKLHAWPAAPLTPDAQKMMDMRVATHSRWDGTVGAHQVAQVKLETRWRRAVREEQKNMPDDIRAARYKKVMTGMTAEGRALTSSCGWRMPTEPLNTAGEIADFGRWVEDAGAKEAAGAELQGSCSHYTRCPRGGATITG